MIESPKYLRIYVSKHCYQAADFYTRHDEIFPHPVAHAFCYKMGKLGFTWKRCSIVDAENYDAEYTIGTFGENDIFPDDRFIQIHRNNCDKYKSWVNGSDLKSIKCKSFGEANDKAHSIRKEVITDISDDCIECQPSLNLQSILKSI